MRTLSGGIYTEGSYAVGFSISDVGNSPTSDITNPKSKIILRGPKNMVLEKLSTNKQAILRVYK
jgi:hypothetical protein